MSKYVRMVVSAALLSWIAWHTDWARVQQAFATLRVDLWFVAFAILAGCQIISARRWQLFARALHFDPPFLSLVGLNFIGMYFNLLLPTSVGGDVMRAWFLDAGSGRKKASFAVVLLDRLNGLFVLIAMACLAVAFLPPDLPVWISTSAFAIAGTAILGVVALPLLLRLNRLPADRVRQVQTMIQALHAPRTMVEATLWSVLVQIGNAVLVWVIGRALEIDVPLSYYFVLVPMVSLLTLLPVSVNGMGVREGGIVLFLTPCHVEPSAALTLAFLWFAIFLAAGVLGGVIHLFGLYPKLAPAGRESHEAMESHGSLGRDSDQGREGQFDQAA